MPSLSAFMSAAGSVFSVFAMILTGYGLSAAKKINKDTSAFISWTVLNVSLPCYMARYISDTFEPDRFRSIPEYIAAPLLAILAGYGVGWAVTSLLKVKGSRRGLLIVILAHTNTIFMGLPVNMAMFGEESVPYVLYYYMANTIVYWTLGIFTINSLSHTGQATSRLFSRRTLWRIISPPLLGLFLGLALAGLGIRLPRPLDDALNYIGELTTPLSMFFIGHVLCNSGLSGIKLSRDSFYGLVLRFILGPAINLAVFALFPMPRLMRSVFMVQACMPVMANLAVVAEEYGSDSQFAAQMCALSTVVSLLVLPLAKVLSYGG